MEAGRGARDRPAGGGEALVTLLGQADAEARAAAAGVPTVLARLNVFRLLLRRPELARSTSDLLLSLLAGGALAPRLRELQIMRVGWATASEYEWAQHWRIARDVGVGPDEVLAVRDPASSTDLAETDRLVLQVVDEVLDRGRATPGTVGQVVAHLGEDAALEAVAVAAVWAMVSVVLQSFDVPLEAGVDPWPPDGLVPPTVAGRAGTGAVPADGRGRRGERR